MITNDHANGTIILVLYKYFVIKYHSSMRAKYKNISALYAKVSNPSPSQKLVIYLWTIPFGAIACMMYFHANIVSSIIGKLLWNPSHWSSWASLFLPRRGVRNDYFRSFSGGGYFYTCYGIALPNAKIMFAATKTAQMTSSALLKRKWPGFDYFIYIFIIIFIIYYQLK